ncbi:MAG: DUF1080 domain-containing protein [Planctomycetaceae bacterium]
MSNGCAPDAGWTPDDAGGFATVDAWPVAPGFLAFRGPFPYSRESAPNRNHPPPNWRQLLGELLVRSNPILNVLVAAGAVAVVATAFAADNDGFKPLFDGKSLAGWRGDDKLWTVADGTIVGATDGDIPDNTFLIHDGEYGDFVLKVKFRLHNHTGNSGIQYRSEEIKERNGKKFPPFVVGGYQADIASERYMGILYGEKTPRGIIKDVTPEVTAALEKAVIKDGWNEYVITVKGHHVTQSLNGVTTVDIDDPEGPTRGIIALQLHRGHNMRISFKDIVIKTLD